MARAIVVSKTSAIVGKESHPSPNVQKSTYESKRGTSSPGKKQQSSVSGLGGVRELTNDKILSEGARNLLNAARRGSTRAHYNSAWRQWLSWCSKEQVDSVQCPINHILNFLAFSFEKGLEYNTIAGYRSALSAYHDPFDGIKVGSHPKVSELITGIFNERCPKPRYCFVWDVKIVIRFLDSLGTELSDKMLTLKLTMLLALTSVCRAHEIRYLDTLYMIKSRDSFVFHFGVPK